MSEYKQLNLWDVMFENVPQEDVPVEGVVNLKTRPISHYKVNIAYGELTLIIAVLRDYVKGFDKLMELGKLPVNEMEYEAYYRKKFLSIADRISEQIEYDYDAQVKKCLKNLEKQSNSDIGDEALSLALKRG